MSTERLSLASPDVQAHLAQTLRTWIGIPAGTAQPVPRLPDQLARLLLRVEEFEQPHRDQWGCWEFSYSENYRRGRLWVPEVDEWVAEQRRELDGRTALEPLWPDGHRFAMCLTHDVDMITRQQSPAQAARALRTAVAADPSGANGISDRLLRAAWSLARSAHFGVLRLPSAVETFQRCIQVEQEYGVTSSYFFTIYASRPSAIDCVYKPDDAFLLFEARATVAELARRVSAEGCDVGLHGSYFSALDAQLLAEEKRALEEIVQQPVETTRQHYLHFDAHMTPGIQQQVGFRADSTLGFNRNVGFRAGTSMPFRLFDFDSRLTVSVIELPLVIQEFPLLRANALELDADLARETIRQLIASVEAVGGIATILFHPHSLSEPTYLDLYRYSIEYGLDHGAWIAPAAQLSSWWLDRERRLIGPDPAANGS